MSKFPAVVLSVTRVALVSTAAVANKANPNQISTNSNPSK